MKKRTQKKRLALFVGCSFLTGLAALFIVLGVTVWVPHIPTTMTMTPTPTPTPDTCDTNYVFEIHPPDINLLTGHYADYYVNGNSFVSVTLSTTPNKTFSSKDKSTNATIWETTLCADSQLVNIYANQTDGSSYFFYTCNLNTYLDKYDIVGNLLWRTDVTTFNGTTQNYVNSELVIGTDSVYFSSSSGLIRYIVSVNGENGSIEWFTYTPIISGSIYSLTFDGVYIYGIFHDTSRLQKIDTSGNIIVNQILNTTGYVAFSIARDTSNGLFVYYVDVYGDQAFHLQKYDANTLAFIWDTKILPTPPNIYMAVEEFSPKLYYDPNLNRVLALGETSHASSIQLWVAQFYGNNGTLISYYQSTLSNPVSVTGTPFYNGRTLFYMYESSPDFSLFTGELRSYCY